ncbi:hypothetical protein MNEG_7468 [Monoraphidium neglectum]|uniref:Uncharacterized protein n=1 Tax=Monoraphidium neglectum TaxID=145388 RepID=A0A0D2MB39_9CHLO|nr:hypothetical protein MNEG_7468 [Monoraphidium neglectum]KIZ00490.1 hypothetical protein MNEG_7468 [Monoraphidium neglectum]|eukprot:XP_013899509.1 hypothetical protein MNEG_7468 [Monoraphidium neglectum]
MRAAPVGGEPSAAVDSPVTKVEAAAADDSDAPQQPATAQEQVAALGKGILENRRLIAVAVAVADVAFLWVAVKLGKGWWDSNH